MTNFFSQLLNKQDKKSILRLFSTFLVVSITLFLTLTLLFLLPKIHSTFETLQTESDRATTHAFASKLDRYLLDRELALVDIADNPLITNAVLLADGTRPDFRDFISHILLLGEDPELTVLNVEAQVLYSEREQDADYQWVLPLVAGDANKILNLIAHEATPQFEIAVPVFYGRGREGVIIARFDGKPSAIYNAEMELNNGSAVFYSKNGVSILSDISGIKNPHKFSTLIESYGINVTHFSSRTLVIAQKRNLIFGYIISVVTAGALAFFALYFLGRKIIVAPYLKLALTQEAISKAVEGIAKIDPNGRYVTLNQAYAGAIGYEPYELISKNWEVTVHPEDLPMLGEAYQKMLKDGKVTAEARGVKKDGSVIYKQVTMISQYNDKGIFIGHHCFMKDISARKLAELEREKLVGRLLDSNDELERFAFVCSHDLQEPLRMITSFSEKLQLHIGDGLKHDEKGQKYFNFITDGATRAQGLISDILTYSSLDRDAQQLQPTSMNLIVDQVQATLISSLEQGKCIITSDDLPVITGNITQFFQLFQNLINNSLKYQSEESIAEVHISAEDTGTHWTFSIRDNGIGIDSRHLSKIFDVFQRLHRRTEYAGTGVGLSICKKIVERHGGNIWVESKKGHGSTFYFTILKSNTEELSNAQFAQAS